MIVSRLLCERLDAHEALLAAGFERFSSYRGYSWAFEYAGPYYDAPGPAASRPQLVAIDAIYFARGEALRQFASSHLERELNKALVGFTRPLTTPPPTPPPTASPTTPTSATAEAAASEARDGTLPSLPPLPPLQPVCTGNWGCGAFGGDLQLKAILQLMAASEAGRPSLTYLTFGDQQLADGLNYVSHRLHLLGCTVGSVARVLLNFHPQKYPILDGRRQQPGYYADLFAFLNARMDRLEAKRAAPPPPAAADATESVAHASEQPATAAEAVPFCSASSPRVPSPPANGDETEEDAEE